MLEENENKYSTKIITKILHCVYIANKTYSIYIYENIVLVFSVCGGL